MDMGVKPRFILVGGFLGAGKTTALVRLAKHYNDKGLRVALITNDQANNLVDTTMVRLRGFRVEEVAGGCFCCKFEDLAEAADRICEEERPDILLAEPVGSCTDLVATVVQPLRDLYGTEYAVAPYTVLLDPARAERILVEGGPGGFSDKVVYIFRKQLEEADAIVLSKVDLLPSERRQELLGALPALLPHAQIMAVSAVTGEGLCEWIELLAQDGAFGQNITEVDYDLYADGEAELGWLNATAGLRRPGGLDANMLLLELASGLQEALKVSGAEPAHLKMTVTAGEEFASVHLVAAEDEPLLSRALPMQPETAELTMNARVHSDPEVLRRTCEQVLAAKAALLGVELELHEVQSFKPGRPKPTHRYDEPVA